MIPNFNSLKEVSDYAYLLLRENKISLIKTVPDEEIINVFTAGERFLQETANKFCSDLGITKNIVETHLQPSIPGAIGLCDDQLYNTKITISFNPLFLFSYEGFLTVLVHEISHIGNLLYEHNINFWLIYFNALKTLKILDEDLNFEDEMIKRGSQYIHRSRLGSYIRNHYDPSVLSERLVALKRHKVFRNQLKYSDILKDYCVKYCLDYNIRYRRKEIGDLKFENIEKSWNRYYDGEQYYKNLRKIYEYRQRKQMNQ